MIDELREHREREIGGRAVHGGDADRRHALGAEAEARPGAERDVDGAGRERLLQLRVAAES